MSKTKQERVLEKITVSGVAAEGKALAKVNDLVVFVPFAAPGDVVDIRLTKKKRQYAEGVVLSCHHRSPLRVESFCSHFGLCGGCKWQHLLYSEQLKYKQQEVEDHLQRIGKLTPVEILPILAAPRTQFYRNKLEFTFARSKWLTEEQLHTPEANRDNQALGFHIPGRFDKVLDIETCYLQTDLSNRIRRHIKDYCLQHEGYDFPNLRHRDGFMRTLLIRTSETTGEVMVIAVFFYDDPPKREALLRNLNENFPEITALLYCINDKCNDTITDCTVCLFHGNDHITEVMEGLRFRIGPKSFYQTNSAQAYELYKEVRRLARPQKHEVVYDLYTGIGTIALFIARDVGKVVGVEYVAEAVEDARGNASRNEIDNTCFLAGDMKDVLNEAFVRRHGRPDLIITDPPRSGMHAGVIEAILAAAPERIVYVSCNAATQARDLALLAKDYTLQTVRPVDMFPHTHHVENIALLVKHERV
ncbi:MAG: 23S rRNA (uracil(1939)-C(5))-methyltransferase RlmD [Tannerellaceae bacterium]|jgi:23S rRNA (uracil1939-C5)-methyltransferase|nr:23S rRNA (uracil(1939)-C(5))-methyltransferase RlmD [Tannerellaceae bacterium]